MKLEVRNCFDYYVSCIVYDNIIEYVDLVDFMKSYGSKQLIKFVKKYVDLYFIKEYDELSFIEFIYLVDSYSDCYFVPLRKNIKGEII